MIQDRCFEPLRQKDASVLAGQEDRALWEHKIRSLRRRCDRALWLIRSETQPIAIAGLSTLAEDDRSARLYLDVFDELKTATLKAILQEAFERLNVYRLEWRLSPAQAKLWQAILSETGFVQEGRLRKAHKEDASYSYQDVMMYTCHRPLRLDRDFAFIAFRGGVFAIYGDAKELHRSAFLHFESPIADDLFREAADWLNLLDARGFLLNQKDIQAIMPKGEAICLRHAFPIVKQAAEKAARYFAGTCRDLQAPLNLVQGSEFQNRVWQIMHQIPYGQTWSYADLARRVKPQDDNAERTLARAVGSACGANPLPLWVPCHRVIGSDGRLIGFSSGIDIKNYLLEHEMLGLV